MVHIRQLLVLVLIAVLAACGGPSTPPDPDPDPEPDPTVSGVSPAVAPRGASIVVSGVDFGTSGTLAIGGVEADVTSWSDTSIEAVVAAGTPNAWQDIEVVTNDGTASFEDFFVGVEYTGTAGNLQAFLDGLVPGTAVLLQAQTYDLSAAPDELIIDNRSLHGRGESQTTIVGSTATGIVVLADFGEEVTLADMTVEVDSMAFFHGSITEVSSTAGTVGAMAASTVPTFVSHELGSFSLAALLDRTETALDSAASVVEGVSGSVSLAGFADTFDRSGSLVARRLAFEPEFVTPAGVGSAQINLSGVTLAEVSGGGFYGLPFMFLPAIDLTLDDVTIDADDTAVFLVSTQDIALSGVDASAGLVILLSYFGSLSVTDSSVVSGTDLALWAESGIAVDGSTVRASNGAIQIIGAYTSLGVGAPAGGPITITGSTVEALDADFGDGSDVGEMLLVTQYAPIRLVDNVLVRSHGDAAIATVESFIGEADVILQGNQEIRVGVFQADDAVDFRAAGLELVTLGGNLPDTVRLEDNDIAATQAVVAVAGAGAAGNLVARNNTVVAGDGLDDGSIFMGSTTFGAFVVEDNDLSVDSSIELQAIDLGGGTAVLTGNQMTAVGDSSASIVVTSVGGSCDVSGNGLLTEDTGGDDPTVLLLTCLGHDASAAHAFDGNTVANLGSGGSVAMLIYDAGTLSMDSNAIATEVLFYLVASAVEAIVSSNDVALATGTAGWFVLGDVDTEFVIDANVVTYEDVAAYGLFLSNVGDSTVTGNSFMNAGTPGAASTALVVQASANAVAVTASGNTFTNFSNALAFVDVPEPAPAFGVDAAINGNVFDFEIDAAPKVALLDNIGDIIDATGNQWGTNTDLTTVEGYVTLDGDTALRGGDIDLDPIVAP